MDGVVGMNINEFGVLTQSALAHSRWIVHLKQALKNPVLIIGSLHLSLMSAVGIWLWSKPAAFGDSQACSLSASVIILGKGVPLGSKGLQDWSIFIYTLLLVPGFNLVIPITIFMVPYLLYNHTAWESPSTEMSITPITGGLTLLAVLDIVFLVNTELGIQINAPLRQSGDSAWTFGQTLALLLLLVPLRDLVETLLERRQKQLDVVREQEKQKRKDEVTLDLWDAIKKPETLRDTWDWQRIQACLERGGNIGTEGKMVIL